MRPQFRDRTEAGRRLAAKLTAYANRPDVLVLALPRGGVPVGAPETCAQLREVADDVVCARTPEPFHAVGLWYEDFSQTTDEEVRELLARAKAERDEGGSVRDESL